jgi:predicted membrane protein
MQKCLYEYFSFLLQIIKMMITVVVIYSICWLPLHIITIAGDINITFYNLPGMNIMWTVAHWLAMSNCMYNPFIYCWMNAKYRNGFINVFSCFTCGLLKSREEKIELQRMRRSHNNTTSVGSTFSHPYHRASATFDTEYSFVDGKHVP